MGKLRWNHIALIALIALPMIWLMAIGLPSRLSTDLLALAPAESLSGSEARAMRAANAIFARNVFLSIDGLKSEAEWQHATELIEQLVAQEYVFAGVFITNANKFPQAIWDTLQKYKQPLLLPKWLEDRKTEFDAVAFDGPFVEWLASYQAEQLDRFLERPEAVIYTSHITTDPLLLLPEAIDTIQATQPQHSSLQDRSLLAWITLDENPFDTEAQNVISEATSRLTAEIASVFPEASVQTAGVYALAQESAATARREVTRLNIITAIVILVLLALLMRQRRSILMVLIPLVAAIVWALLLGILVFGQIHVFALGMSAVLLGLAVDYGIHAEVHRALKGPSKKSPWAEVRLPLVAGCLSTCIGFLAMTQTPILALKQVAVLVPGGLLAALGAVYLCYSSISVARRSLPSRYLAFFFPKLKPTVLMVVFMTSVVLSVFVLFTRAYLSDSVADFQLPSAREQQRLGDMLERVSQGSAGERWVLYAPTAVELVKSMRKMNDQSGVTLFPIAEAIAAPADTPLTAEQRTRFTAHFMEQLQERGFDAGSFRDFSEAFVQVCPENEFEEAMTQLADVLQGPLAFSLGREGDLFFSAFTLSDAASGFVPPTAVSAVRIAEREHLDRMVASASHGILKMCLIVFPLILVLLLFFFRGKDGLIVALLPLWAVLCGNAVLAAWSPGFSLISVIGSVLAYCLALDYAAFAVTERGRPLLSVRISAVTTFSAFAVLTTSSIAALNTLGWAVCLPIVIAWGGVECVNAVLDRNVLSSSK